VAPEIVVEGEHGYLVAVREPAALAAGIEALYARRHSWPTMAAAARRAVLARYAMDAVVARYAALLRRVTVEKAHPGSTDPGSA
jgi:glycosyltransferase involved in cell wall biosynthesis